MFDFDDLPEFDTPHSASRPVASPASQRHGAVQQSKAGSPGKAAASTTYLAKEKPQSNSTGASATGRTQKT